MEHRENHICLGKFISGRAILIGALVGLGLSFLFNLFSMAINLTAFKVSPEGVASLALGGFIGVALGNIIAMFVMGWVAGFLGREHVADREKAGCIGVLYGFGAWCLALVVTVLMAAHMTQFIASNYHFLTNPTAVMKVTTNSSAPLISTDTNDSASTGTTTVNAEKAVKTVGVTLFCTFIMFFLAALSSCMGGYYGMKPKADMSLGAPLRKT